MPKYIYILKNFISVSKGCDLISGHHAIFLVIQIDDSVLFGPPSGSETKTSSSPGRHHQWCPHLLWKASLLQPEDEDSENKASSFPLIIFILPWAVSQWTQPPLCVWLGNCCHSQLCGGSFLSVITFTSSIKEQVIQWGKFCLLLFVTEETVQKNCKMTMSGFDLSASFISELLLFLENHNFQKNLGSLFWIAKEDWQTT